MSSFIRLQDMVTSSPGAFTGYQEVWDQVMCCICFEHVDVDDLEPVSDEPGVHWNVCKGCAWHEKAHGAAY